MSSTSSAPTGYFETAIVPIFNASCGTVDDACHSRAHYEASATKGCRGGLSLEDSPLGAVYYIGTQQGQPTGCPDRPLYDRLVDLDAWECGSELPAKYVVPCKPDESYVMRKIAGGPYCYIGGLPSSPMPPMGPLASGDIDIIRQWILAGAPLDVAQPGACGAGGAGAGGAGGGGIGGGGSDAGLP